MAINGREYNAVGPDSKMKMEEPKKNVGSSSIPNFGKIFGIMFIWLLFTAGIAFGLGFLFGNWYKTNPSAYDVLFGLLIGSGILLIVLTLLIQFFALKKGKGMLILSSLYVLAMGVLCSTLVIFIDWYILGIALGITTLIFGVLALIGFLAKNIKPIAMIGIMLVVGAALTALITWLIILFSGGRISGEMQTILWIVDFAMFGGMLLLIIVDMNQIKRICEKGEVSNNLALYCALTLYSDFIYIFLKIAYYLAMAYGRSK